MIVCVAFLMRNSLFGPLPGQLSTTQADTRRAEVAAVEQQRLARVAKRQAELQECQTQAESLSQALALKRAALKSPSDQQTLTAFNQETARYQALLQRIKIIQTELENAYYAAPAPAKSIRRSPAEKAALPYADEDLLELEAEPVNVRNRLSEKTDLLLAEGNFAELDRIAAELRTSKVQCANGVWHLRSFYDGFAMLSDYLPETAWTDRIATFQSWINQYPDSITPRIALASVWDEWAWAGARGQLRIGCSAKGLAAFRRATQRGRQGAGGGAQPGGEMSCSVGSFSANRARTVLGPRALRSAFRGRDLFRASLYRILHEQE